FMGTSLFIAKILGLVYLVVGVGMLLNKAYYEKMMKDFTKESGLLYFGGAATLVIGYLMVTHHNVWTGPWWVVLVTVFSWLALVKGVMLLVFPKVMTYMAKFFVDKLAVAPVFMLVLGAIFAYYGFGITV
ncbi:MAG: hypothetical protein V1760_01510, partial [Candidatus Peregrinibacteria bacterium]